MTCVYLISLLAKAFLNGLIGGFGIYCILYSFLYCIHYIQLIHVFQLEREKKSFNIVFKTKKILDKLKTVYYLYVLYAPKSEGTKYENTKIYG